MLGKKLLPSIILHACHVSFYWQPTKLGVYVEGNAFGIRGLLLFDCCDVISDEPLWVRSK
jgi:hypothetical protein